ncbi:MAG TPA: glycosyltransferase family 4 protein [Planctomycetota bacterium]|nr:glycosyltransferase family 4 protein [Planctomycetota bacterium]
MKIGFVGNTNNYPFLLARAMHRLGHPIEFIVHRPEPLHRPESSYGEMPAGFNVVDLATINPSDVAKNSSRVRKAREVLNSCDAVIANELGPAICSELDRPFAALITGSDLTQAANPESIPSIVGHEQRFPRPLRRVYLKSILSRTVERQREGIRRAVCVGTYLAPGILKSADRIFADIGVDDRKRFYFVMIDTDALEYAPSPAARSTVRILCVTRHVWKQPFPAGLSDADDKRSDIMLRGLALFLKQTGLKLDIRLVKKGNHVTDSIELSKELGIDAHITWLNEMTQKQVRDEMRQADVVLEQFGQTGFGMSSLEAMCLGRPVILNCRPDVLNAQLGNTPACHAEQPEQIAAHLEDLVASRERRESTGRACRAFVLEHLSTGKAAEKFLSRLSPGA